MPFQSQIFDVYKNKAINEERRFINVSTHQKNQHLSVVRQWRTSKRFFTGETGAWAERYSEERSQENVQKVKSGLNLLPRDVGPGLLLGSDQRSTCGKSEVHIEVLI